MVVIDFQWVEVRHNMLGVQQLVGVCQDRSFFLLKLL